MDRNITPTFIFNKKQTATTMIEQDTIVADFNSTSVNDYYWMVGLDIVANYGTYHIDSFFGEGGEAILFRCSSGEKQYILKYYVNVRRMSQEKREKFISLLLNQTSPYIVPLVDYGEYQHKLFDIYPYKENGNLSEKTLSLEFIRDVVIPDVNEALHIIHSYNIAHRDIKPNNILISDDGSHVMLNDFSIMSIVEESTGGVYTETAFRTNGYAGPEILMMMPNKSSDYYAFGITLLSLLHGGINLFQDMDEAMIYNCTVNGNIPKLNKDKFHNLVHGTLSLEDRIEGLVCGLTIYDHQKRWGYEEINKWMQGELDFPEIEMQEDASDFDAPFITRDGKRLFSLTELAEYIADNWELSGKDILRGTISNWLVVHRPDKAAMLNDLIETTSQMDVCIFKTIYALDDSLPVIYWRGTGFSDFSSLAVEIENGTVNIDGLLKERGLSWFVQTSHCVTDDDNQIAQALVTIENKAQDNSELARDLFLLQFLPYDMPRCFQVDNHRYQNVNQMIYDIGNVISDKGAFSRSLLCNDSFHAWMIFYGYEEVYSNAVSNMTNSTDEDCFKRVLVMLDVISDDKESISKLILGKSEYSHIYWLKEHLNDYEYMDSDSIIIKNKLLGADISSYGGVGQLIKNLEELHVTYIQFSKMIYSNPFHVVCGIVDPKEKKGIIPKTADAAFVYRKGDLALPAGYVTENHMQQECFCDIADQSNAVERDVRNVYQKVSSELKSIEDELLQLKVNYYQNNYQKIGLSIIAIIGLLIFGFVNGGLYIPESILACVYLLFHIVQEIRHTSKKVLVTKVNLNLDSVKNKLYKWKDQTKDSINSLTNYYDGKIQNPMIFDISNCSYYTELLTMNQKNYIPAELYEEHGMLENILYLLSSSMIALLEFGLLNRYIVTSALNAAGIGKYHIIIGFGIILCMLAGIGFNFYKSSKPSLKRYFLNVLYGLLGAVAVAVLVAAIVLAIWLFSAIAQLVFGIIVIVIIVVIIVNVL